MKRVVFSLFLALAFFCLPGISHAEEDELAPGFKACMDEATSTATMMTCMNNAIEHWEKVLAKNYAQAEKNCEEDDNRCAGYRSLLQATMTSWKTYRADMAAYLGQVSGGTMDRLAAASFDLDAIRLYARTIAVADEDE